MNPSGSTPFSDIADFKSEIAVINPPRADEIRDLFVQHFINREHPNVASRIATLRQFSDGPAYVGYLWDYLARREPVSESTVWARLSAIDANVYAMWDIHSESLIRIPNYWKLPKRSLVEATIETIHSGLAFLPEDLYIFDPAYSWCAVLTHEQTDAGDRYCLFALPTSATDAELTEEVVGSSK